MSYKFISCLRGCGSMVCITTYQKSEWKKNRGIVTKYKGICDRCLTPDERKEVADDVLRRYKKSGAVSQKTKKEHTLRQPRKKYDKPLKVIGTREIFIKGD